MSLKAAQIQRDGELDPTLHGRNSKEFVAHLESAATWFSKIL